MTARTISLLVLTGLIACLGLAFLRVVQPFLLPLLLAVVTAMVLQPVMRYFLCRTGQRQALSAALTTLSLLAVVMVPLTVGIIVGATQLYDWSSDFFPTGGGQTWPESVPDTPPATADAKSDTTTELAATPAPDIYDRMYRRMHVGTLVHRLQPFLAPDAKPADFEKRVLLMVRENLPKLLENIANQTLGLAATTFGFLGSLAALALTLSVYITAVYFFLADGTQLLESTQCLIPVQREHQDRLLDQFVKVTRAVVVGTFAAAVAQGVATGVGLYFAGIERIVLLTVIATLAAVVPMAGTTLVWVPCAIWMCFSRENWMVPVVIFSLYNVLIVASLDNLVRSYVLNSDVKLHPLLAFISVLGGLQWLGLWGVFVGPVIASCLYALATIVNEELAVYGKHATKSDLAADVAGAVDEVAADVASVVETAKTPSIETKPAPTVQKPVVQVPKSKNKRR